MAATSAFAQNAVTLYGTLDVGLGNIAYEKNNATVLTRSGAGTSHHDSSRWGLTGKEDLGGGMAAEFKIESAIGTNPRSGLANNQILTNGTYSATGYTLDATVLGDREIWAALSSGATRVQVGYGVTQMRNLAVQTDAAQSNQYGNQIAHDIGGYRRAGVRVDYNVGGGLLVSGGVSGARQNASGNVSSTVTTPTGEFRVGKGWTLGTQYTQGPINAGYFHDEVTGQNPTATLITSGAGANVGLLGLQPAANLTAANATKKTDLLAGSYDAGVAKLFAQYYSQNQVLNDDTSGTATGVGKIQGTSVGVRVPVGKATFYAQSLGLKDKQYGASNAAQDRKWSGSSYGVRYDLSKRTSAYLNAGSLKKDASTAGSDNTNYKQTSVGIVHNF